MNMEQLNMGFNITTHINEDSQDRERHNRDSQDPHYQFNKIGSLFDTIRLFDILLSTYIPYNNNNNNLLTHHIKQF